jgi:hypothetical protein
MKAYCDRENVAAEIATLFGMGIASRWFETAAQILLISGI